MHKNPYTPVSEVDFWAPPLPSALPATPLGNPDAGITLPSIGKNNRALVHVQSFSFSFYFRNSVSP